MSSAVVRVVFDSGREEGVDEGRLSKSRFASDHDGEGGASLCDDLVSC
jgi:hypothetical protein